jgi:cytochrome c biogenesis protein CcmG, thiol:disulfide interchange protein DsbE
MPKRKKKKTQKGSMIILWLGGALAAGLVGIVLLRIFIPSAYYELKDTAREISFKFKGVGIGQAAPNFQSQTLDGQAVTLSQFRGQTLILAFSTTWCPDCRNQIPLLTQFYRSDPQVVLLDIDTGEPLSTVQRYVNDLQLIYPILVDSNGVVAKAYQVTAYPTLFVIDPQGIIRAHFIGEVTEADLNQVLAHIAQGD